MLNLVLKNHTNFFSKLIPKIAKVPKTELDSYMLIDPFAFQDENLWNKYMNKWRNNSTYNDMESAFKTFKRANANKLAESHYLHLLQNIKEKHHKNLEQYLSDELFKEIKKAIKNKEELPYYLPEFEKAQVVQARSYSENVFQVKSTNKWYQLTCEYIAKEDGEKVYHVLERNDKAKDFKFIKFNL